jgi:hypothetical protein
MMAKFSLDSNEPYGRVLRDVGWPRDFGRWSVPCIVLMGGCAGKAEVTTVTRVVFEEREDWPSFAQAISSASPCRAI